MTQQQIVRTSSDLPTDHWMAQQLPAGTSLRGYAEDRAVSILTTAVTQAVESAGLTRADVARALGTTKSYVSQVLNGSTNMTLKTLGALLWAVGRQVGELRFEQIGAAVGAAVSAEARPLYRSSINTTANPYAGANRTYRRTGQPIIFARSQ